MGKIRIKKDILTKVTVLGDGSWPTALIKILSEEPIKIKWWVRLRDDVKHIRKFGHNPNYLPSIQLKRRRVRPYSNLKRALKDTEFVVLAIPATYFKGAVAGLTKEDFEGKKIISAIKGLIPEDNMPVTDYMHEQFGIPWKDIAIVSGPCHAEEVAMGRQSYLTIAGEDDELTDDIADLFTCRYVSVNTVKDIHGVEYSAVMKNIVALACGICHGLNMGDNFQAVLVSNAMQEIDRFLTAIKDVEDRDTNGSAYLGDLLVTAYSQFSRNRTFGSMIGRGYTVKSAMFEMRMVAEGYYAVKCIHEINKKYNVYMPICNSTYNVLYERISPKVEMQLLINELK